MEVSVHLAISHLSFVGSYWKQAKPEVCLQCNIFKLRLWDPQIFQDWMTYILYGVTS